MSRFHALPLLFAATALLADDPFTGPRSKLQYQRDRQFDFQHLKLEFTPDADAREVRGVATHTLSPLVAPRAELRLDAADLSCDGASVDGADARCAVTDSEFIITLPREYKPGETLTVAVKYHGAPRKGIYFFGPRELGAGAPYSIWTQGEDEDNRYWYPGYDYPNDKFTSEMIVTVPAAWTAISNGALLGVSDNPGGTRTWHWKESVPHSNYLVSLVAGEYEKFHQSWNGIDVDAYVPRGRLGEAERSFGRTPAMMEHFSKLTGQPYPYEKYAQSAVPEFIFGGMENISATTQSDRTLHPAHLEEEESSDGLVAHELAHQWFGNYVSFKDWSNAWLSEGFATYFEWLWAEQRFGGAEAAWKRAGSARWYFGASSYRKRAIVTHRFSDPQDLFDSHAYPKGGWVIHMLRVRLGDERFFAGMRRYVADHGRGVADSEDLRKSFEAATGENLDEFFDQWVYHPGHPQFEISWSHDTLAGAVQLKLAQKQKTEDGTRIFRVHLPLEILYDDGAQPASERRSVTVDAATHEFTLKTARRPVAVLIDPDGTLLASVKLEAGEGALLAQLARATNPVLRARAADQLAELYPSRKVTAGLIACLKDGFYGVRPSCAAALARGRTPEGRAALLRAIPAEPSGRARGRMVSGLTPLRHDPEFRALLRKLAESDPSDNVRAGASGVYIAGDPGGTFEWAKGRLGASTHHEVVRGTIFEAWASAGVVRALPLLMEYAKPGAPRHSRSAAIRALGGLAPALEKDADKRKVREFLAERLDDPRFHVAGAAIDALERSEDPDAAPALRAAATRFWDSRQKQDALDAAESLAGARGGSGETAKLREQLRQLEKKQEELEKKQRELERKLDAPEVAKPAAPAAPAAPAPAPVAPVPAATTAPALAPDALVAPN